MKMKKIVLLFSMIAVFFSLTACSSGQEDVTFEYTNTDIVSDTVYQAYNMQNVSDAYRAYLADNDDPMAEVLLTGISNMDNAKKDCGEFKGYRSKEDGSTIMYDFNRLQDSEDETAKDDFTSFISMLDYTVEESNGNVTVNVKAVYEKHDVEYSFVYEENSAYAYSYELTGQSVSPYQVKEITATPDYSFGEIMGKAAANTLMGMGTVFIVLIFISLIIGRLSSINALVTKLSSGKKDKEEATPVATPAPEARTTSANPMDDAQLVAVITAAVAAANEAAGGTDSLVVRSIRKAKRY